MQLFWIEKMKGKLTIIPTPIDADSKLNPEALDILLAASAQSQNFLFLVEDQSQLDEDGSILVSPEK